MDYDEFLEHLKSAPLKDLEKYFSVLAKRIYQHRKDNNGFVPFQIYPYCLTIAGQYACVEIILAVINPTGDHIGYPLRLRGKNESGWNGLYHVAGNALRLTDSPKNLLQRVLGEWFNPNDSPNLSWEKMKFLGNALYYEEPHQVSCLTPVWLLEIQEKDTQKLIGEWKLFSPEELESSEIINFHRGLLKWAHNAHLHKEMVLGGIKIEDLRG